MDVESARQLGIAVIAGAAVLAVLAAVFVRRAIAKAVVILALGALIVVVFDQRSNISDCASRIKKDYETGVGGEATCTVLGRRFTVNVPTTVPLLQVDEEPTTDSGRDDSGSPETGAPETGAPDDSLVEVDPTEPTS